MSTPRPGIRDIFWFFATLKSPVTLTDDFKIAALTGNDWRMLYIAKKLQITEQSEWGFALVEAAKGGQLTTIKTILEVPEFAAGSVKQSWLDTALEIAAKKQMFDAAVYLQEAGGDPSYLKYSALKEALGAGLADVARKFYTAATLSEDITGACLQNAVFSNDIDCVRFVLERSARITPEEVLTNAIDYTQSIGLDNVKAVLLAYTPATDAVRKGHSSGPSV